MKLIWISQNTENSPNFIDATIREISGENAFLMEFPNKQVKGIKAFHHADCLNAELADFDCIFWDNNDFDTLKSVSPLKHDYGWIFVSLNLPIYVKIESITDLSLLSEIKFDGVYSDNLELLEKIAQSKK